MVQRACGSCAVCCVAVGIAVLDKPARVPCRNLDPIGHGCTKHGTSGQPAVCAAFSCAWLGGFGHQDDRPNDVGVMITVQDIPDGRFALALEFKPGAALGAGRRMIADVATATRLPVIVSDYESLPPDDKGDRVAVHTSILYRARRLVGPLIEWLGPDVALYTLVKGAS